MPVVSGVGHETDVTLSDFAADVRAPTPTAAAELVVPATQDCLAGLRGLQGQLRRRTRQLLDAQVQRLDASALRLARPTRLLHQQAQRLAMLDQRMLTGTRHAIVVRQSRLDVLDDRLRRAAGAVRSQQAARLQTLEARLRALDPRRVLSRGYAWLADVQGAPIQSVRQLAPGQSLDAVLSDGTARMTVDEVGLPPSR